MKKMILTLFKGQLKNLKKLEVVQSEFNQKTSNGTKDEESSSKLELDRGNSFSMENTRNFLPDARIFSNLQLSKSWFLHKRKLMAHNDVSYLHWTSAQSMCRCKMRRNAKIPVGIKTPTKMATGQNVILKRLKPYEWITLRSTFYISFAIQNRAGRWHLIS